MRSQQSNATWLRRRADRICALILNSEYPMAEVAMERFRLREECERILPEKVWLYDLVYESRFERLIEQWRIPEEEGLS